MENPIEVIAHKEHIYEDYWMRQKRQVYTEYKKKFNDMADEVMSSHNKPEFAKILEFVTKDRDIPDALQTCLLVNSKQRHARTHANRERLHQCQRAD
ncbi:MAG: hypothetical protein P4M11_13215 [Candidatus Pacebacteria bacterium]|nr:hypothetical protein [Candidatus Paceibacterota bacterium]